MPPPPPPPFPSLRRPAPAPYFHPLKKRGDRNYVLRKTLRHRRFPVNIKKFSRTIFLAGHLRETISECKECAYYLPLSLCRMFYMSSRFTCLRVLVPHVAAMWYMCLTCLTCPRVHYIICLACPTCLKCPTGLRPILPSGSL